MLHHKTQLLAAMCLIFSLNVSAQDEPNLISAASTCDNYLNTTVQPLAVDRMFGLLSRLPTTKGEYESTTLYNERIAKAAANIPRKLIVNAPIDKKYILYNPDTQLLTMSGYALNNVGMNYNAVFGSGGSYSGIVPPNTSPLAVTYEPIERNVGSYRARNAFGAEFSVTRLVRRSRAVVWNFAGSALESIWSADVNTIFQRPDVPPVLARSFKQTTKAAFVFSPKSPYYATGQSNWEATASSPFETQDTLEIAFADVECAMLLDSHNFVFAILGTHRKHGRTP